MLRPFIFIPLPEERPWSWPFAIFPPDSESTTEVLVHGEGLPPEIRNMIYAFVFEDYIPDQLPEESSAVDFRCDNDEPIIFQRSWTGCFTEREKRVLLLNKTIRAEASSFFFSHFHMEITIELGQGLTKPFFYQGCFKYGIESMKHLLIRLSILDCCHSVDVSTGIDLTDIFKSTRRLENVNVSLHVTGDDAKYAQRSAITAGLASQVLRSVPSHINLTWDAWKVEDAGHFCEPHDKNFDTIQVLLAETLSHKNA